MHFFGQNCDYFITRNVQLSQRHTFAITTDIKLCVFARYYCYYQIKAPVDLYKLGVVTFGLNTGLPNGHSGDINAAKKKQPKKNKYITLLYTYILQQVNCSQ